MNSTICNFFLENIRLTFEIENIFFCKMLAMFVWICQSYVHISVDLFSYIEVLFPHHPDIDQNCKYLYPTSK